MKRILFAVLLLSIFTGGYIVGSYQRSRPVYTPDVEPEEHHQLKDPDKQTDDTIRRWLRESIIVSRDFKPETGNFTINAHTSWTETIVHDRIAPSFKRHVFFAGPGIDHEFRATLSGGYLHFFNESFGAGGMITASETRVDNICALVSWRH